MLPMRENIIGDDTLPVALREFHRWCWPWRLFIEHRTQLGLCNYFFKDREFSPVKLFFLLFRIEMTQIQWPDANLRDFKRVEHVHGYGIRSLIGQVTANSAAKTFKGLTDIYGLAVVVVKGIDAPLATTNSVTTIVKTVEE